MQNSKIPSKKIKFLSPATKDLVCRQSGLCGTRTLWKCYLERVGASSCGPGPAAARPEDRTRALRAWSDAAVGSAPPAAFSAVRQSCSSGFASVRAGWRAPSRASGSGSGWQGQRAVDLPGSGCQGCSLLCSALLSLQGPHPPRAPGTHHFLETPLVGTLGSCEASWSLTKEKQAVSPAQSGTPLCGGRTTPGAYVDFGPGSSGVTRDDLWVPSRRDLRCCS